MPKHIFTIGCTNRRRILMVLTGLCLIGLCWGTIAMAAPDAPMPLQDTQHTQMSAGQAAVLGLVEGVTEYLPVSSTGHLLLTQHLMGIATGSQGANDPAAAEKERSKIAMSAYEIVIQAGAILAVLLLYSGRVRLMIDGLLGHSKMGRRLAINVIIAFLPAAVLGVLLHKRIEHYLFGMWPVVIAWLIGGFVILLVTRRQQDDHTPEAGEGIEALTPKKALVIGGLQCISMWPGVSRSLTTILGGMLVGLSAVAAVEFSFLLGLLTLTGATVLSAAKEGHAIITTFGIINPLIGFAVACVSAMAAVKWMVGYLNKHGLAIFGYYRIALAVIICGLLALHFLQP